MQGSLDAPPIIIRSSRGNSALMLLIATIFVVTDALSVAPDGITWCGCSEPFIGYEMTCITFARMRRPAGPSRNTWGLISRTAIMGGAELLSRSLRQ